MNLSQFGELLTPLGKVLLLAVLTNTLACRFIQELTLVQQAVVDQPQRVQSRAESRFLRPCRVESVPKAFDFDASVAHGIIVPQTASKQPCASDKT